MLFFYKLINGYGNINILLKNRVFFGITFIHKMTDSGFSVAKIKSYAAVIGSMFLMFSIASGMTVYLYFYFSFF